MPVETPSLFAQVIQEHLELRTRNRELEERMPIGSYKSGDPFENHPLFKTEEQARLEDTLGGTEPAIDNAMVLAWRREELLDDVEVVDRDESLWGRSRDFDWGD